MDTPGEGRRVDLKTDRTLTAEQLRWAGIRAGHRVLDLGCAGGTTCRLMADVVGQSGRVVGVDISASRLTEGTRHPQHRATIEYRLGRAEAIPALNGEFDVSWSRFLFEYLPDPAAAIAEMVRVTVPGGRVCVSDIDGNCIWHHPRDSYLLNEIDEALSTLGDRFNPRIGMSLYTMCVDAGLQDMTVDIRPYHIIAGRIDENSEKLWKMKLDGVATSLRELGWSAERTRHLVHAFLQHLSDPRSLTYSVIITVRGRVPKIC